MIHRQLLKIFLILIFILTSGFGCKIVDKEVKQAMQPVTLEYWRVFDGPDDFDEIFNAYKKLHPFIGINYRKLRYSEYEAELVDALAEDRGPDIFSIHNTWVQKYKNKIEPVPPSITMAYPVVVGSVKKEIIPELRTRKSLTLTALKNKYIDAVYNDVVIDQRIFGLPLAVDTLVLYYNRDLLNNAGIAAPPAFWNRELQQNVRRLTKQDSQGQIIQSGIALGGGQNIERSADILAVLMMQNGAKMTNESGQITFHKTPAAYKDQYNPGLEALRFYSDFANPSKEVYSWNSNLPNSLEMFIQGKLAFMLGYSYHLPTIKAQGQKLNLGIAHLPQIEDSQQDINFANYWIEVVSKKSDHVDEAWDFIQFATMAENIKPYLKSTNKPSALRIVADEQLEDETVGIFASQVLTSKTWYKGKNFKAAEKIIHDMIEATATNQQDIETIIKLGSNRLQQTLY